MDGRSKVTLKRMKKYHPNEKIILIDGKQYSAIEKKMSSLIAGWGEMDLINHPDTTRITRPGWSAFRSPEHMNFCLGNAVKYIWRAWSERRCRRRSEKGTILYRPGNRPHRGREMSFEIDTGHQSATIATFISDWFVDLYPEDTPIEKLAHDYAYHLIGALNNPKMMKTVRAHFVGAVPGSWSTSRKCIQTFDELVAAYTERWMASD